MPKAETSCKTEKANDELLVQCLNRFAKMQQQFASVVAEVSELGEHIHQPPRGPSPRLSNLAHRRLTFQF